MNRLRSFTVRESLLVVTCCALAVGWWVDRNSFSKELLRHKYVFDQLQAKYLKAQESEEQAWRILQHSTDSN